MTTLDQAYFNGPIPLHGRLVREVVRDRLVAKQDGTLGPAWELHLHAEWQCVVVEDEGVHALVPLHWVRSMVLTASAAYPTEPPWLPQSDEAAKEVTMARRGRARTKRLGVVRE